MTLKQPFANAAVTVVHSGIRDLGAYTRRADIVIAAAGSPGIVQPDMVQPGAVVVSGGISWEGRKLLPDVDEAVGEVASWITPRLGGVGPTTVAMLLRNTILAAEKRGR
jgi:methylenetetrahydrofolate dehydrogenase (NADP+)/methenyltetrahydrofolate cyclohydrolase